MPHERSMYMKPRVCPQPSYVLEMKPTAGKKTSSNVPISLSVCHEPHRPIRGLQSIFRQKQQNAGSRIETCPGLPRHGTLMNPPPQRCPCVNMPFSFRCLRSNLLHSNRASPPGSPKVSTFSRFSFAALPSFSQPWGLAWPPISSVTSPELEERASLGLFAIFFFLFCFGPYRASCVLDTFSILHVFCEAAY